MDAASTSRAAGTKGERGGADEDLGAGSEGAVAMGPRP